MVSSVPSLRCPAAELKGAATTLENSLRHCVDAGRDGQAPLSGNESEHSRQESSPGEHLGRISITTKRMSPKPGAIFTLGRFDENDRVD